MHKNSKRILLVDDESLWQEKLGLVLKEEGYDEVTVVSGYGEARGQLQRRQFHLAIVDLWLPTTADELAGMALLRRTSLMGIPTIVVTARGTRELADKAFDEHKVFCFIDKSGFDSKRFVQLVGEAIASRQEAGSEEGDAPLSPSLVSPRLEHLADNIEQDLALLKEYEDALRYEDDPRRRARYRREIEGLRKSAAAYQVEYDELQAQVSGKPSAAVQEIGAQLQQMNETLARLRIDHKDMLAEIDALRSTVLDRFEAAEQNIVGPVLARLDETQLTTVETVLDALEDARIPDSEVQEVWASVQQMLSEIQRGKIAFSEPGLSEEAKRLSELVKAPTLDAKHKLKATVPIIPTFLSYEAEIGLGSSMDLEAAWQQLKATWQRWVAKVRGKR